ncbi:MAG: hypothetical protein M3Q72_05165 [Actinomycetota bacterium]|nr:hypothetical protein [Actinomycetota bacterium]MDQ3312474.1 hypothetical protein [Actinomycetota bacterium]
MSDEHKAALAQGRTEGRIVRDYLEALRSNRPKRGRKRTEASITRRLEAIEKSLSEANPLNELKLVQERRDLLAERESMTNGVDLSDVEEKFVQVAKEYGERQGISYSSWREVGVQPNVLKRAGISRSG